MVASTMPIAKSTIREPKTTKDPLAMPLLSSIKQSTMVKAVITIPMHIHTLAHSGTVVNDKGSNILFFRHGRVGFWFLV
jgi:hypothetical protein